MAPTGVTTVRGDASVAVSWTANSADYDADGYRVLRGGTAVSGLLAGRATTTWTDTGLTNDTTDGYTVQTHDTSGNWSASSTPAVPATPTDLTAPAAPTGLTATAGTAGSRWRGSAAPEPDVATYRVLRGGVELATVPVGTITWDDTGLTNDTTYSYSLAAVDTHGTRSATSAPAVAATPTDLTPPAAPTGFTAARGDGRVPLSWSPNGEPDLALLPGAARRGRDRHGHRRDRLDRHRRRRRHDLRVHARRRRHPRATARPPPPRRARRPPTWCPPRHRPA